MRIERDRYGAPRRVNDLLADESLTQDEKWCYINLSSVIRDHFTFTETTIVRQGFETRLRDDGFVGTEITVTEDFEPGRGDWRYCIDVSAAWWGLL